jgi:beta-barrel assembly-enhancing protease
VTCFRRISIAVIGIPLLFCGCAMAAKGPKKLKPGFNLFSPEQDVQMGKEYAAQVEKEMPIVADPELANFFVQIGQRLAGTQIARESGFPFTFKVVHDASINAFALPGGPTFMHTGLITNADNEAQLAGVVAHEISHVILRHGTNQASKANLIQLPAMIGGAIAGGGMMGQLAQLGIGLGANSVLMKFSRGAETDADLLGTRIMHEAGYNPIEMARFFEKLEAEAGKGGRLSEFFASHPNPGNRVKRVQDEIKFLPVKSYSSESGNTPRMKQLVTRLGEPPKRAQTSDASAAAGNPDPAASRPARQLTQVNGGNVTVGHPSNWEVFPAGQGSTETTIAPRTGLFQTKEGGVSIGYGMIVGGQPTDKTNLRDKTQELVQNLLKGNPGMHLVGGVKNATAGGRHALIQEMASTSPYPGGKETDVLLTVEQQGGLFYIVFISPSSDYGNAWPVYEQVIASVRFSQ